MFDFRSLVKKYSHPITVEEETDGFFDYEDGGNRKKITQTRETTAAAFNLTTRDINGLSLQYGEGDSYTKEDIKVYIHEPLAIGSKITHKGKQYTVSTEVDHEDHAHGLRIYIARRAGNIIDDKNKK